MADPKDKKILELWRERRSLLNRAQNYSAAIDALQKLCSHVDEVDVSYHGSPNYECPDCGKGMLP